MVSGYLRNTTKADRSRLQRLCIPDSLFVTQVWNALPAVFGKFGRGITDAFGNFGTINNMLVNFNILTGFTCSGLKTRIITEAVLLVSSQ